MTRKRDRRSEDGQMSVIAHRANTLTALARRGSQGIDVVECDVTEDGGGRIVVGHPGHISQAALNRAPTLRAYLGRASRTQRRIFVDLKLRSVEVPAFARRFARVVRASGFRGELIITSDEESVLRRFRRLGFPAGHIVRAPFGSHRCSRCDLELIPARALARAGLRPGGKDVRRVVATEVEDAHALRSAHAFEVGEVMTNFPGRLRAEIGKRSIASSR